MKQMQKPEKIKAMIFDLDGVLVDSINTWHSVFNIALEEFKRKGISLEEFEKYVWGVPAEKVIPRYFGNYSKEDILKIYNNHFAKHIEKTVVFPESAAVMQRIKKAGIKTAIASNSHSRIIDLLLIHFKLKDYFDIILSADQFQHGKPNPEMLFAAIEKLSAEKDNVMFVGDTHNDITAGKDAEIFTIGIRIDGDERIENLEELPEILGL